MKHLKTIITFFTIALLFNCETNDDTAPGPPPPISVNSFSISGTQYDTDKAYLLLDDGPQYSDAFGLTFLNGTMIEDNVNGASIETATTLGVVLWVKFSNGTVTTEQAVTNQITSQFFTLDEETTAITNIVNYNNTHVVNSVQYGEPDDATAITYELGSTGNGTVDVRIFTVDLVARTGTIDCVYTFVDNNNNTISGVFIGSFDIINEF